MSGLEHGDHQPQAVCVACGRQWLSASSSGIRDSGQAGLHGNVLQGCSLLAAFC